MKEEYTLTLMVMWPCRGDKGEDEKRPFEPEKGQEGAQGFSGC